MSKQNQQTIYQTSHNNQHQPVQRQRMVMWCMHQWSDHDWKGKCPERRPSWSLSWIQCFAFDFVAEMTIGCRHPAPAAFLVQLRHSARRRAHKVKPTIQIYQTDMRPRCPPAVTITVQTAKSVSSFNFIEPPAPLAPPQQLPLPLSFPFDLENSMWHKWNSWKFSSRKTGASCQKASERNASRFGGGGGGGGVDDVNDGEKSEISLYFSHLIRNGRTSCHFLWIAQHFAASAIYIGLC